MNVWIWGPPLWDTLHSCSALLDDHSLSSVTLFEPLTKILPCRFCRDSFDVFYKEMGPPLIGSAFEWIFSLHNKVNKKLALQKIDALGVKYKLPKDTLYILSRECNGLFGWPSIDVVRKRQIVSSDDSVSWSKVSTALLAITMGIQQQQCQKALIMNLTIFVKAIQKALLKSKQSNIAIIMRALDGLIEICSTGNCEKMRTYLELMKYKSRNAHSISDLIKAGACVSGTCK